MTRINCIPPEDLLDQHLLAEYNETAFVHSSLKRSLASCKRRRKPLPRRDKYTLNQGHVIFFYDKGKFLFERYESLKVELRKRGFELDESRELNWSLFEGSRWNDWEITLEAQLENVERIYQRYMMKPSWYKFWREQSDQEYFENLYLNWKTLRG